KQLPAGRMKELLTDEAYKPAIAFYNLRDDKFIPAIARGDKASALALARCEMKDRYEEHRNAIDKLVALTNESNTKLENFATETLSTQTNWLVGLGLLVIGVVLFIAWVTGRMAQNLTDRIAMATSAASQVSSGDLTVRVNGASNDETGQLLGAICTMTTSLHSLVGRVKKAS